MSQSDAHSDHGSYWQEWTGEAHWKFYSRHQAPEHPGYIYVLQTKPGSPVKIGTAKNVRRRIATLQCGNENQLRLLLCFPGSEPEEHRIHRALHRSRVRGEWFGGPAITDFLERAADYSTRAAQAFENSEPVPEYDFLDERHPPRKADFRGNDRKVHPRWRATTTRSLAMKLPDDELARRRAEREQEEAELAEKREVFEREEALRRTIRTIT